MTEYSRYVGKVLDQAGREAQRDGSTAIEAQHVLLAIAGQPETAAGQVLAGAGLDRDTVRAALDGEFAASLSTAGVSLAAFQLPRPDHRVPVVNLGASVRLAIERGAAGIRRDLRPAHLLLGVLRAEVGTVPRMLALAGVDRTELIERVRDQLAGQAGR